MLPFHAEQHSGAERVIYNPHAQIRLQAKQKVPAFLIPSPAHPTRFSVAPRTSERPRPSGCPFHLSSLPPRLHAFDFCQCTSA